MNAIALPQPQANPLVNVFNAVIDGISQLAVNARDLHSFLKVGRDFTSWIKNRINQYVFIKNVDFIIIEDLSSPNRGNSKARPQKMTEYHLALDMAKELAMVENNEEGRKVRRYFIRCEKELYKSTSTNRELLVKACTQLSVNNAKTSDVYIMVGKHFGFDDGIKNIPAPLLPEALAFVYEMIIARHKVQAVTQMSVGGDLYEILSRTLNFTTDYAEQTHNLYLMAGHPPVLRNKIKDIKNLFHSVLTYVNFNGIKNSRGEPMYQNGLINNYSMGGVILPPHTVAFMA